MWILLTLLVILVLSSMYREYSNLPTPDHLKCKESMLQQMFWISARQRCIIRKPINEF